MAYRFDTSRLTFFGSVNFPGETPENGEDAGNVEHQQVAVLSTCGGSIYGNQTRSRRCPRLYRHVLLSVGLGR
jgi:hypothetical protein